MSPSTPCAQIATGTGIPVDSISGTWTPTPSCQADSTLIQCPRDSGGRGSESRPPAALPAAADVTDLAAYERAGQGPTPSAERGTAGGAGWVATRGAGVGSSPPPHRCGRSANLPRAPASGGGRRSGRGSPT